MVDDDEDILDLLSYNLNRQGYEVMTLKDPTQTISKASDFCPDLFILDVMMPYLDGYALCKKIRETQMLKESYIIFLSFVSDRDSIFKALALGANEYLEKISDIRLLMQKIDKFFKK